MKKAQELEEKHGHGHGDGHCCGGKGHKDGQGHCGRHGHTDEKPVSAAAVEPAQPGNPGAEGRCCRDRD